VEHKEELEWLLAQEQEAMAGEVPGTLWEAFDHFPGTPKKEGEEKEKEEKEKAKAKEGDGKEVARTS